MMSMGRPESAKLMPEGRTPSTLPSLPELTTPPCVNLRQNRGMCKERSTEKPF